MDRISLSQTPQRIHEVKRLISSIRDVKGINNMRVRRVGDKDLFEVEVLMDENIRLNQAHSTVEKTRRKILKNLNYVKNVSINFKPKNT